MEAQISSNIGQEGSLTRKKVTNESNKVLVVLSRMENEIKVLSSRKDRSLRPTFHVEHGDETTAQSTLSISSESEIIRENNNMIRELRGKLSDSESDRRSLRYKTQDLAEQVVAYGGRPLAYRDPFRFKSCEESVSGRSQGASVGHVEKQVK